MKTIMTIPISHKHFYHGPHCPVLISREGKCNGNCLEQCIFHGPNCKVGVCLTCWLDGRDGLSSRVTIHHFMPGPPAGPRKKREKK